jgi:hypothetical protein
MGKTPPHILYYVVYIQNRKVQNSLRYGEAKQFPPQLRCARIKIKDIKHDYALNAYNAHASKFSVSSEIVTADA